MLLKKSEIRNTQIHIGNTKKKKSKSFEGQEHRLTAPQMFFSV